MGNGVALAEKLQQEILKLPQEALPELEKYIEFLRFKVGSSAKTQKRSTVWSAIHPALRSFSSRLHAR